MSTVRKFYYKIIMTIVVIAVFAAAIFATSYTPRQAHADSVGVAALDPIVSDDTDVTYRCFDSPTSVFADSAGLIVSGKNSIEYISGETEVTATRKLPADKSYRHLEHGEHGEYLITLYAGKISLYFGEQNAIALTCDGIEVSGIVDFSVFSDKLYALTSDTLYTVALGETAFDGEAIATSLRSARHNTVTAHNITALDGCVYVVIDSAFGTRHDVCSVDSDGALTVTLMQSDTVLSITSAANTVYALTRGEITAYDRATNGGLIKRHCTDGELFTDIYTFAGNVYAIDSLNALHKLSGDLSADTVLFASSSDIKGYFNTPSGVAVKNSVMYVADTLNNRIAVYGNTIEYADREFINPVSVACDSANTVYVAYEYNKIGIFGDGNFSQNNERTVIGRDFGAILQIAVNADKTLYILTDNGLWALENGGNSPERISDERYKAIALGVGKDKLYALDDVGIYEIAGSAATIKCAVSDNVISFAVDFDGSVFMLTETVVRTVVQTGGTRKTQEYSLSCNGENYTLGGKLGQIVLCTVANNYVDHGDIIIVDGNKHRIFKTSGSTIGVKLIYDSYQSPELPTLYEYGIIRTAVRNAEVFELPMEAQPIFTITRGRNVIVPIHSLDDAHEYSLVYIDDIENGRLVSGYVFKDALSEPLAYSTPPNTSCSVFNAATPIYSFPSRHAKTVPGYAAVDGNTQFGMLDFVDGYRDDYGNLWYRIALNSTTEGYILSINVSTSDYEPVFIHPAYNAEIISYKGSEYAPGYVLENGVYTQITQLATGARIEVIGSFDSSKQYTEVKFFDADRGTLTCFVETVYIQYNGVNIVLLVAIIIIIITVTLAAIIVARVMHNKKKNLANDDEDETAPTEQAEK